jgi:hypothetical protein
MDAKFSKWMTVVGVIVMGFCLTLTASAACGTNAGLQRQSFTLEDPTSGSLLLVDDHPDPIVGFWQITFTAKGNAGIPDGAQIDKAFAQWHSDGTEIMNSSRPPITSSFCLGVWEKTAPGRYKLNHFAISWDQGNNLVGPANIRENVRLSRDGNSFMGTFTIDQYDQSGNTLAHVTGELSGKRIGVNTPIGSVL